MFIGCGADLRFSFCAERERQKWRKCHADQLRWSIQGAIPRYGSTGSQVTL